MACLRNVIYQHLVVKCTTKTVRPYFDMPKTRTGFCSFDYFSVVCCFDTPKTFVGFEKWTIHLFGRTCFVFLTSSTHLAYCTGNIGKPIRKKKCAVQRNYRLIFYRSYPVVIAFKIFYLNYYKSLSGDFNSRCFDDENDRKKEELRVTSSIKSNND